MRKCMNTNRHAWSNQRSRETVHTIIKEHKRSNLSFSPLLCEWFRMKRVTYFLFKLYCYFGFFIFLFQNESVTLKKCGETEKDTHRQQKKRKSFFSFLFSSICTFLAYIFIVFKWQIYSCIVKTMYIHVSCTILTFISTSLRMIAEGRIKSDSFLSQGSFLSWVTN